MIKALSSDNLPAPLFRYSALVKAGPFYQTAGMIAVDKDNGRLIDDDVAGQAAKILANLQQALADFDLSLDDLVSARIYTTQLAQFAQINQVWESVFSADGHLPARTAVGVSELPLGAKVEMEFSFYKEPD